MSLARPDTETATFAELQDAYDDFYVPQFTVTVGKTAFEEQDGVISDVSVDLELDAATAFSFTLNYPWDAENGQFRGLDWELFVPDQSVAIEMGYGKKEEPLLHKGHITSVKPNFPSGGSPTVDVSGYGQLHTLTSLPESVSDPAALQRTWEDTPPGEVIQDVKDRGYTFEDVETPEDGPEPTQIKQKDSQNDLEFLLHLGEKYAYELFAWDGTLYFRPPRYEGPPDLVLRYGTSLDSFSPEVNETGQVDKIEVRNWDAEAGEEIVGEAPENLEGSDGGGSGQNPTKETLRLPVRTTNEAKDRAKAVLANRLDGTVSGNGECVGLPEIRPGSRLKFERIDRFEAVYYVESATHRFGGSGYQTSFSAKRREL